jgi:soluble lytic murein transglycosylase-like protein
VVLVALLLAAVTTPVPALADAEIARRIERLRALRAPLSAERVSAPRSSARHVASGEACRRRAVRDPELAERAVRDAWLRYAVPRGLIRSVIRHESAGNPAAVSPVGAVGLMQLMPATAQELGVPCPFAPRQNVLGGARYLRQLRDRFGSWGRALAAYHAGPTRVREDRIPEVTRRYVTRVLATWRGGGTRYWSRAVSIP